MSLGEPRVAARVCPIMKGGVPDVPLHLVGRTGGFLNVEIFLPVAGNACGIGAPDFTFYR